MAQINVSFDDESYSKILASKPIWQKKSEFIRNLAMKQLEEEQSLKKQGENTVSNPPFMSMAVANPYLLKFTGGVYS